MSTPPLLKYHGRLYRLARLSADDLFWQVRPLLGTNVRSWIGDNEVSALCRDLLQLRTPTKSSVLATFQKHHIGEVDLHSGKSLVALIRRLKEQA